MKNVKCRALVLFLLVLLAPGVCWSESAILRLYYRNASEVLPLLKDILSREGRAAVDHQSNSLVIVDTPESIRRVEVFLKGLDAPVRQMRVRVKFVESESLQGHSLEMEGGLSGRNWRVSKGKPADGVAVRAGEKTIEHREGSEYYLQVGSGNWAYIAVGKDIPLTRKWIDLSRRHGKVLETAGIRRIETGFDVRPVILGDRADVEILPRISREEPGAQQEVVRFAGSSTHTTVPLRQWVEVGAADTQGDEVMSAILETGSGGRKTSLSISLMVEAVE